MWAGGRWATTGVVVRSAFLSAHQATVKRFLAGLVDSVTSIRSNPAAAQVTANRQLATLSGGKALPAGVLASSFRNVAYTTDPLASTYATQARHAEQVGLLRDPGPLGPMFDLRPLDAVLDAKGQQEVEGP